MSNFMMGKDAPNTGIKAKIDWTKYPKLALMFQNRPLDNIYWVELIQLIKDLKNKL